MANSRPAGGRRLIFLDASVIVAASRSPSGGSAVAIEACQGSHYRALITEKVLLEARTNIVQKFGDTELLRFYKQLADLEPQIVAAPSAALMEECIPLTTEKDAHVLAAALEGRAEYLLTLDRRHLLGELVLSANLPVRCMTPGTFLQEVVRGVADI